jgi:hypothetical protein
LVDNSAIEPAMTKDQSIKELISIPSIGISIANDLWNIGIRSVTDLKDKDPEILFDQSNIYSGADQDMTNEERAIMARHNGLHVYEIHPIRAMLKLFEG